MSAIASRIPGSRVLDLFAGSGALGLEALSRGAERAVFVENAPAALKVLRSNIAALEAQDRAEVVRAEALRYVTALDRGAFDLAFADPPYARGLAEALVRSFLEHPFAALLAVEHGVDDAIPLVPDARTRRYGSTLLSLIPAPA